jgi:thiol-disulfide isomerase/thioredoxin
MTTLTLEHHNRAQIADLLSDDTWAVACLCAAWCDVCNAYRPEFDKLAMRHPDKHFLWIDVEDQAELVGDFDVENFPTLLMQRGDVVAFYGTVQPDARIAERLLLAQVEKSDGELRAEAVGNDERKRWQQETNLRRRLLPE